MYTLTVSCRDRFCFCTARSSKTTYPLSISKLCVLQSISARSLSASREPLGNVPQCFERREPRTLPFTMTSTRQQVFDTVPEDVLFSMFAFCEPSALGMLAQVSQQFRTTAGVRTRGDNSSIELTTDTLHCIALQDVRLWRSMDFKPEGYTLSSTQASDRVVMAHKHFERSKLKVSVRPTCVKLNPHTSLQSAHLFRMACEWSHLSTVLSLMMQLLLL